MNISMGTHLVMQSDHFGGRSAPDVARAAVDGGIDVVQLREKHASAHDRYKVGRELRAVTVDADVPLAINDWADIMTAIDVDGAHLDDDDVPVSVAREQFGEGVIVDRLVSTVVGVRAAEEAGTDYLDIGAVFATDMKETNPEQSEIGAERVSAIAEIVSIPFAGIGGVTPDNAADVVAVGTDGVAVVSATTATDDPADATRHLTDSAVAGRNRR